VENCHVLEDQILREQKPKSESLQVKSSEKETEEEKEEIYRPVCCDVCSLEIAVLDSEDVYHFFQVIAS
jgi:hypothetical protein